MSPFRIATTIDTRRVPSRSSIQGRERGLRPWVVGAGLVAGMSLLVHAAVTESVGGPVSAVAFLLAGLAVVRRRPVDERHAYLMVFAVAVTAVVLVFHENQATYGAPYWNGGSDDLQYEEFAQSFRDRFSLVEYSQIRNGRLASPSTGGFTSRSHNSPGYVYVVAVVGQLLDFAGFYEAVIAYRLMNALLLALSCVLVMRICKILGLGPRAARATALAVTLQPLMLWVAGHTLRDVLISTLVLSLVFVWVRLGPQSTPASQAKAVILSVVVLAALTQLRLGQAYVATAVPLVGLWAALGKSMGLRLILALSFFGAVVAVGLGVLGGSQVDDVEGLIGSIDSYRGYLTEVTGGGLSRFVFEAPFPLGAVLRIMYLLVSPVPVADSQTVSRLLIGIATLVNMSLLYFLARGLRESLRSEGGRLIAVGFLGLFLGVALFTFTPRQMVTFVPLAGILIALGLQKVRARDRLFVRAVGFTTGLLLFAPYLLLG